MDANLIYVSSGDLTTFQVKLRNLSQAIFEARQDILNGLSSLGNDWQDQKYQQFVDEFKASEQKMYAIAEKYRDWANGHLQRKIDEAIEYEIS
ncbi:hypothetical protein FACS1894182_01060 [Bacteroidia bacterium]|nr:hypothetical protein FACS1894182_01060 [Bacteroidia bacterium]